MKLTTLILGALVALTGGATARAADFEARIEGDVTRSFRVRLTNSGTRPRRLWRETCSWGYDRLSFRVRDARGAERRIVKIPRGWDKNFPDWVAVEPGGALELEVRFDPQIWRGAPPAKGESLTAVFEVPDSAEARKLGVWVGKAVSSPLKLPH